MNKVKYFFKMHTKECMLGFCLSLCLIIVLGTYYFCNKEESATKFLVDSQSFESPVLKKVSTSVDTTGNNQEEIGEDKIEDTEETNAVVTEEKIRVDIKGHVFNPGVYEAIKDDRVIDIITKAGGLLPDADTSVNLMT